MSLRILLIPTTLILLSSLFTANAQPCATDELHQKMLQNNPALQSKWQQSEQAYITEMNMPDAKVTSTYVIPVVVHIIHNNGSENISDARVMQGIEYLNQAFENIAPYDPTTGVDMDIEFCLAKRDPDGNATTGINRIQSNLTEFNYNTQDDAVKNLSRWNPLEYVNIWLVRDICSNFGCSVAGYAYFPSAHGSSIDGIVAEAGFMGNSPGSSAVLAHEMGHYLGLYHTFQNGCINYDCLSDGDRVCDTPPDASTVGVPCDFSVNSCSTDTNSGFTTDQDDMIWNYMDYGDWDCYSAFTEGQRDRAQFFLTGTRASLLASQGCLDPCPNPISTNFTVNSTTVNIGETVNFNNNTTGATTYDWLIDGVSFSNATNPNYTFNSLGTYTITLLTTNGDPNCDTSFELEINVICPVSADFTPSNYYPIPGESVTFTNVSQNATNYTWAIDGVDFSTNTNITTSFAEGVHTICLLADSNGLCEDSHCATVWVFPDEDSEPQPCEDTYIKNFGSDDNERGTILVDIPDGFLVGGSKSDSTLIVRLDINGNIVWSRTFDFTSQGESPTDALIDSEGNLVIVGWGGGADRSNYAFKYDYENDNVIWTRLFSNPSNSASREVLEKEAGGNYFILGQSGTNSAPGQGCDALFLEVDRNIGAKIAEKNFNTGACDAFNNAIILNNSIYIMGIYALGSGFGSIRPGLTRMDFSGNIIWSNYYLVSGSQTARLYGADLVVENNAIYGAGRGDLNGQSGTNINNYLFKTNLNGVIEWAVNYDLANGNNERISDMVSVPDGFVIKGFYEPGFSPASSFLLKVDKQGNIQWAKSYANSLTVDYNPDLVIKDNYIYTTGTTANDVLFTKINAATGELDDPCATLADLSFNQTTLTPFSVAIQPNEFTLPITLNSASISSTSTQLNDGDICSTPCVEVCDNGLDDDQDGLIDCLDDDCPDCGSDCEEEAFLRTFSSDEADDTGVLIELPDGDFMIGGGKGDSTLIIRLDVDGDIIWSRTFDFTPYPETPTDALIDSDGNLVLIGMGQVSSDNRFNYILKYNYLSDDIIWVQTLSSPSRTFFKQVVEGGANQNYFVTGLTATNSAPGNGCDALFLEINRNTGAKVNENNFTLGSCEEFTKSTVHNGSIYLTGRYNYGSGFSGMRPAITNLDFGGNELWSKTYLVNPNSTARLYSGGLVIENNSIFIVSNGDINGTNIADNALYLIHTDINGNIQWAREYDLATGNTEWLSQIVSIPDGFILKGNYTTGAGKANFLIKVDKQGIIQWSKSFDNLSGSAYEMDLIAKDGAIYFTSYTDENDSDIVFAKLTPDGELDDSCESLSDLAVNESNIPNPYEGSINLTEFIHPLTLTPANHTSTTSHLLTEETLCSIPCPEICDNNLDDDDDGLVDCADPDCECIEICDNDIDDDQDGLTDCEDPDCECTDACLPNVPTLELGLDITVCENGVHTFDAGTGHDQYIWQDGSTEQTLTAFEEGTYTVTVIDSCDIIQTDSVQLFIEPVSEINFDDVTLCEGDSITLTVSVFFDNFTWLPDEGLSCNDCPSVTITPNQTTEYQVIGTSQLGCITVDTFLIEIEPCIFMEICDNGIDDDGDGLIDCYDPDCCEQAVCMDFYYDDCPVDCEFTPDNTDFQIEEEWRYDAGNWHSYNTAITGDVDGDGVPEVVGKMGPYITGQLYYNDILIINGQTGNVEATINTPEIPWAVDAVAIADINKNGFAEIVVVAANTFANSPNQGRLHCYEYNPANNQYQLLWISNNGASTSYDRMAWSPEIADFNGDGNAEVYIGNQIFNGLTGQSLTSGGNNNTGILSNFDIVTQTVAVDVLPDNFCTDCSGLELVAGNQVYSINDALNSMNVEVQASGADDGFVGIADMDKDGDLDAVIVYGAGVLANVYIWDIQTTNQIGTTHSFNSYGNFQSGAIASQPNIADIDNDGNLDIGISGESIYKFLTLDNGNLNEMWSFSTSDESGRTGSTIFDFEGDGDKEIAYRDETQFRIFDAAGNVLFSTFCTSGTAFEYPVIVDVDADGETELLCSCNNQLVVYGSATTPWLPTRSVWNQHAYFNVNINDDLTIPPVQQEHHIVGDSMVLNNFLTQYSDIEFPVADAEISIENANCAADEFDVSITICNIGDNTLSFETPITFYDNNPTQTSANPLITLTLGQNVEQDECLTQAYTIPALYNQEIYVIVNDDASLSPVFSLENDFPVTAIAECDFTNNIDNFIVPLDAPVLDLGQDTTACDAINLELNAGSDFSTYEWQDGSVDSTFTVTDAGIYSVIVTDICGNSQTDDLTVIIEDCCELMVTTTPNNADCTNQFGSITTNITDGEMPYTYLWDTGAETPDISDLGAGTYTITVTDNQGCMATATAELLQDETFDIQTNIITQISCSGTCDGSAVATPTGGTMPYTYQWSNSLNTDVITDLCAGTYTLTVTDANDCENTAEIQLDGSSDLIFDNVGSTPISCLGGNNGTATASATGGTPPYTYAWSTGAMTETITNLAAGIYTLTITDASGCKLPPVNITVVEPLTSVSLNIEATDPTCNGLNDGYVTALPEGGTPSYDYQWSNGSNTQTTFELTSGNYILTVTDANGCTVTANTTLNDPEPILADISTEDIICFGDETGTILIENASGGMSPYTYSLDGENYVLSDRFTGLAAGAYSVYVQDAEGCVAVFDAFIIEPPELLVELGDDITIELSDSTQLSVQTNSTDSLTYLWNPPNGLSCIDCAEPIVNMTDTETYTVLVTDSDGCTATDDITINVDKTRNVFIPNVFSPNNDGTNDIFMIYGGKGVVGVLELKIYDRWGELIFENYNFSTDDPTMGWNGTFRGQSMNPAVFVYHTQIEFFDGVKTTYAGDITLVK